ncbi:membrane protein [Deinococcus arenae]|uniref:Membrane protein n=1 Tax=Deinococcus arenae TaxID=1452751 RepID=A0A8H9LD29_9DEIO|nr:hypothetical protein [Deinococcus arenae]AWT34858.1 hypothetical protein DM785_04240 [Deinococcus actinosclerus]GGM57677.1 membrane protein [Deinococcus arenae]
MDALAPYLPLIYTILRGLAVIGLVHALITRQPPYWMITLGFAAFLGGIFSMVFSLVYVFTVLIPSLRGGTRVAGQAVARGVEALKPLDTRIREAQARLDESDTLQHRADLAALQARAGRPDDAQATLASLLSGIYADDPVVLLTSAELDLARGDHAAAEHKLTRVDLRTSAATRTRTLTLLAQAQDAQGKPDADQTYRDAITGATTEEPRARYAAYLIRQGRAADARTLLDQIAKTESRATNLYRRQEREWFQMAAGLRKELK